MTKLILSFSLITLCLFNFSRSQTSDITLLWVPTWNNPNYNSCGTGTGNDTIRVTIQNQGPNNTNFGDQIYVYYQIDNGPIIIDSLAFLANGGTWQFEFSDHLVDLSACDSSYQIKTWVWHANDPNNNNDTLSYTYNRYCSLDDPNGTIENDSIYYSVSNTDTIWVTGYPNATAYQWQYSPNTFVWNNVGFNVNFHVVSFIDTIGWYRCLLSNPACPQVISDTVVIRYQDSTLSIHDFDDINLKVFPNPFDDYLVVSSKRKMQGKIIDTLGRQLSLFRILKGENQIPTDHLPSGKYFLVVSDGNQNRYFSLVKSD